jgi:hypothetical protein
LLDRFESGLLIDCFEKDGVGMMVRATAGICASCKS